jgi:hypothetical protein
VEWRLLGEVFTEGFKKALFGSYLRGGRELLWRCRRRKKRDQDPRGGEVDGRLEGLQGDCSKGSKDPGAGSGDLRSLLVRATVIRAGVGVGRGVGASPHVT